MENQLKVDSTELKANGFQLKSFLINRFLWGLKGKLIESVDSNELKVNWFNWNPFLAINSFEVYKEKSIESRFKWIEHKFDFIKRFLWGLKGKTIQRKLISIERLSYQFWSFKGKSIENKLISIEILTQVDHPESRTGSQENGELLSSLQLLGGAPHINQ